MFEIKLPRAIDSAGAIRLFDETQKAVNDTRRGAIVFFGDDEVFCDGIDLMPLVAKRPDHDVVYEAVKAFSRCLALLHNCPKPTIALVDGAARGGGLGFAAACDVVLATEQSRFALTELLWGLLPAIIYPSLRQRLTLQQCRLWILMGGARTAAEARAAGLVDEIVAPQELQRASLQWQRRLSRARPDAIVRLRQFMEEDITEGAVAGPRGITLTAEALLDERLHAALRRFSEDGQPPWEAS